MVKKRINYLSGLIRFVYMEYMHFVNTYNLTVVVINFRTQISLASPTRTAPNILITSLCLHLACIFKHHVSSKKGKLYYWEQE